MKRLFILLGILFLLSSCTQEVPNAHYVMVTECENVTYGPNGSACIDELVLQIEAAFEESDEMEYALRTEIKDLKDRILYLEQGTEYLSNIIVAESVLQERFEDIEANIDELDFRFLFIYTEDEIDERWDALEEWGLALEDTIEEMDQEPDPELQVLYMTVAMIDILIYSYEAVDPAERTEDDIFMYELLLMEREEIMNELGGN